MLHIVLMILKIIGIILAIVLGILLLCVCMVLFIPVKYRLNADTEDGLEKIRVRGRFHWFLNIINSRFVFEDWKFVGEVKVLGRKLKLKEEIEKEEPAKKVTKTKKKKKKRKYTFSNICDKIKVLVKETEKLEKFVNNKVHRAAWKRLKKELFYLIRTVKPKRFEINLIFGADDPAQTGKILAWLSMIYPFFPDTTNITPDFTKKVFKGDLSATGRVRGVCLLKILLNIVLDKNVRTTFKHIEKWKG